MLHLSTKSIHNTSLSPSSSFTSGVSRSSLLSSPREFGSCKLCGKDFSIGSWVKMHIISKHQTDSQDLSLSFFLVHIWSLFSIRPLWHLREVWIGDLCEKYKYDFSGIIFLSRRRTHCCICRELFSTHGCQMSTNKSPVGPRQWRQNVCAGEIRW